MRTETLTKALALAWILGFASTWSVAGAAPVPEGKQLLSELTAQAQKEGRLVTLVGGSEAPAITKLVSAFKQRFGLNINVKVDTGSASGTHVKTVGEMQAGVKPSYDALVLAPDSYMVDLHKAGGYAFVNNWQPLLSEINPLVQKGTVKPEIISPAPFSGFVYIHSNRSKTLLYNKKLISEQELPNTRKEWGNQKYGGKYAVPPWIDSEEYAALIYNEKELETFLETMEQVGKGAKFVATFAEIINRLLLGEIAFMPANGHMYWEALVKDPTAPIGIKFWRDFTPFGNLFTGMIKGTKSPAAATLFVLWMTTPEAHAILQGANFIPNLIYGETELDKTQRSAIKNSGSPVLNWFDSPQTVEKFRWLAESKEGQRFSERLLRAYTQRKQQQ